MFDALSHINDGLVGTEKNIFILKTKHEHYMLAQSKQHLQVITYVSGTQIDRILVGANEKQKKTTTTQFKTQNIFFLFISIALFFHCFN